MLQLECGLFFFFLSFFKSLLCRKNFLAQRRVRCIIPPTLKKVKQPEKCFCLIYHCRRNILLTSHQSMHYIRNSVPDLLLDDSLCLVSCFIAFFHNLCVYCPIFFFPTVIKCLHIKCRSALRTQ
jgi:hypothetical protein